MESNLSFENLAQELGRALRDSEHTLAVAESCTGGLLGATITSVSGSSKYFRGGIIAYSNEIKHDLLGIPTATLDQFGAVSEETVEAMLTGVARLFSAQYAAAVSGIAGPGGGTEEKPVGLVYYGTMVGGKIRVKRQIFTGDRCSVRNQATEAILSQLIDELPAHR